MSMSSIQILDTELSATDAQGEKGVDFILKLRPAWPKNKIRHKIFGGGQLNCMMTFYNEDDADDGIVLRIYGIGDSLITKRDNEVVTMQLAHHYGHFPEVLAFFSNGIAYRYTVGRLLSIKEFEKPEIARKIIRMLCEFHNYDLESIPLVDRKGQPGSMDMSFTFYQDMRDIVNKRPEELTTDETKAAQVAEFGVSRSAILKEIDELEEIYESLNLPKTISHLDYHQRNGIYNDETGILTILDLEWVKLAYESFDIGGLFVEGPWRQYIPHFYDASNGEPAVYTEELKQFYAKEYITRKYEILGRDPTQVTDDVIQLQYMEHELVEALFHLFWMIIFMMILDVPTKPVIKFISVEWPLLKSSKERLPSLKEKYLALKAKVEGQQTAA